MSGCDSVTVASTASATATTTTAATAAEFATTAAAAARTFFTRARDVDSERAAVELLAVHGIDGLLRFLRRAHGHESEAARAAAHAIHHQVGFHDCAVRGERVLQVVFGGVEGKISNKQFRTHVMLTVLTDPCLSRLFPTAGFQSSLNRVHL